MKQTVLILLATAMAALGGDWMQWRGPELNGTCSAKNLPASWSVESGENVAWTCDLPGTGQSTPVITGDRIFLTTSDDNQLHAVCIDRKSGRIAWKKKVGQGREMPRGGNAAHPSAVTDGKTVCFLYGQGTLVAFTLDGKQLWEKELEKEYGRLATKFGFSSSPLLHSGTLYLPLLYLAGKNDPTAKNGTTLLAIDLLTGKTLWEADRPTPATKESLDSYITPVLGKQGIILTGADLVTSHDPKNGKVQWEFDVAKGNRKTNWRIISSPVQADDLTVTAYPRGRTLVALKPGGGKRWDYEGYVPDVCTPAYGDGLLYVLDGVKRYLTCINAQNGREEWQEKIPSDKGFFASPLVADGKVYMLNLNGEVFVYAAGRKPKLLEQFMMGADNSAASIVAVDDALYIRLPNKLICARNTK
ncbi:outer membrane protein assembly factor BamB family protein [Pontiella desulfatans]|nr:PQQ-binding-like beta-propeller repeat protein [Pontiella desulfatans]